MLSIPSIFYHQQETGYTILKKTKGTPRIVKTRKRNRKEQTLGTIGTYRKTRREK
jgi:hypothetical protein